MTGLEEPFVILQIILVLMNKIIASHIGILLNFVEKHGLYPVNGMAMGLDKIYGLVSSFVGKALELVHKAV